MLLFIRQNSKYIAGILCLLFSTTFLFLFSFLTGCAGKNLQKETRTGFYLNTVVSITLYENDPDALFDHCMELLDSYDNMMSRTKKGSDIWNINHSGGAPVTVRQETAELLSIALSFAEMSDGLVDPTIGTLSALWNFGDSNQGVVPKETEIKEALSHVDYRNVVLEGNEVTLKDPDAMLDLGFIAKGLFVCYNVCRTGGEQHVDPIQSKPTREIGWRLHCKGNFQIGQ